MAKFGILLKEDGTLHSGFWYKEEDLPNPEVLPPDARLLVIEDTRPNYEFLYAYFVEDTNRITTRYLPLATPGAFNYNWETEEFTFNLAPIPDLLGEVRRERNKRIEETDGLMLVPDYPADLKQQLIVYRAALRDITNNPDPSWERVEQFPWPERPHFI